MSDQQRETGAMRGVVAALRLAQHDPRRATAALAPVLDGSAPVITPALVGSFLLEAIAREAAGDPGAAENALERALNLAEPDGVLLPFLIQPAPDLLARYSRRRTAHASLAARILARLVPGSPGGTGPGQEGPMEAAFPGNGQIRGDRPREPAESLLEPISEMEMRVLRYLPTNLTAPELAREVCLSVHTIKTHIRHLYTKLGVHGRGEAVQRARVLGLLAPSSRR